MAHEWLVQEGYITVQPNTHDYYLNYQLTQKGTVLGLRAAQVMSEEQGKANRYTYTVISCGGRDSSFVGQSEDGHSGNCIR